MDQAKIHFKQNYHVEGRKSPNVTMVEPAKTILYLAGATK